MKLFPETPRDYVRIFCIVLLLWAVGIGVAFIHGILGRNLSTGIGLGNSLISVLAVILVVGNYHRQQQLTIQEKIEERWFLLLKRLQTIEVPEQLAQDDRDLAGVLRRLKSQISDQARENPNQRLTLDFFKDA